MVKEEGDKLGTEGRDEKKEVSESAG